MNYQAAVTVAAAVAEYQQVQKRKSYCGCYKSVFAIWMLSVAGLVLAVLILISVLLLVDRNYCYRAIALSVCKSNDYACMLQSFKYRRSLAKQVCYYDGKSLSRKLQKSNTLYYDSDDTYYCVPQEDGSGYTTITSSAKPSRFLHKGACGACSNDQDYYRYKETAQSLTKYTTYAAALSIFREKSGLGKMLSAGFTRQCSECWVQNMQNTVVHCLFPCLFGSRKSCGKDGKLTRCLQCDEDYSGMYFRYCAGMTRRRAGIESDICRQDGEIVDKNE